MNENKKKTIAILQSNYIPWKGYFDIIGLSDEFIFYDSCQYTKNDWRNRNLIKTSMGNLWLTIPVVNNSIISSNQKINETKVLNSHWRRKHWLTLNTYYAKSPYFKEYKPLFEDLYLNDNECYLSKINYKFIKLICDILGIKTKLSFDTDFTLSEGKTQRLVDLVKQSQGTEYLSGPAAKNYINAKEFEKANIKLTYISYDGYMEYSQLFPPFCHNVSIVDLIFNCGKDSVKYMKFYKKK